MDFSGVSVIFLHRYMTIWRGRTISAFRFLPFSSVTGTLKCSETTSMISSGETARVSSGEIISFKASAAKGMSIGLFSRLERAISLFKDPSSSRILDLILLAMYCITSSGI